MRINFGEKKKQRSKYLDRLMNCWVMLTSSLRFDTSNTFDIPLSDVGFVWPMPVVVANANAPRLGIALPYAPVVNGVPKPKANGGITLGAPNPFTETAIQKRNLKSNAHWQIHLNDHIEWNKMVKSD